MTLDIKHGEGWAQRRALIDSGASLNVISHLLAKELELPIDDAPTPRVNTLGGQPLLTYGFRKVTIAVQGAQRQRIESKETFLATDISNYDALLGHPWLQAHDPDIRWADGSWHLRRQDTDSRPRIELIGPDEFNDEATQEGATVLAITVRCEGSNERSPLSGDLAPHWIGAAQEIKIPTEYWDLREAFSEKKADELPAHGPQDHAIDIEGGSPPWGPLYNMSCGELAVLRDYIKTNLAKGFIRPSTSSAGAPILFVKKKDGSLRLCVDYRALNKLTKKNRYPLPLIREALDRLSGAQYYTKLDIRSAYNLIRIRRGDEWATAFRTRYGHYEYQVMPFGLANAPATFQSYINDTLRDYLDVFCIAYLDDILVYSETREEHTEHVRKVLTRLLQKGLYLKLEKCEFYTRKVGFVGFVVSPAGIAMEPQRVATIRGWPEPRSFRDIQAFVGFANFYRRFIRDFSTVAAPLTSMLKGGKAGKFTGAFKLTEEAAQAFRELCEAFTKAPVLVHYDQRLPIRVECDASTVGIAGILSQEAQDPQQKHWHPIAFYSRKLNAAEANYGVGDLELLAIVAAFAQWRHYLLGAPEEIEVVTDHNNLTTLLTSKSLGGRQIRAYSALAEYNLRIVHRAGRLNPADAPSRRSDYGGAKTQNEGTPAWFREVLHQATDLGGRARCGDCEGAGPRPDTAGAARRDRTAPRHRAPVIGLAETVYDAPQEERLQALRGLQEEDAWLRDALSQAANAEGNPPVVDSSTGSKPASQRWERGADGVVRLDGRIYLPAGCGMRAQIIRSHHDDPLAGHFGAKRTQELISRKYFWPGLPTDVRTYVASCTTCARVKAARHKPYGELQPLPVPKGPWEDLTMDFITGLPPSGRKGEAYDAILVVVDRYTKMSLYIPCRKSIDSAGLADLFIDKVIAKHGVPLSIVSNRGTVFTAQFWTNVCYHAKIKRRLSTAFHPQTDGQTERQNQTLEQYLRSYVNYHQDDWVYWLPVAEFAYNNSVHSATGYTPHFALTGCHARLEVDYAEVDREVPAARERVETLAETRAELEKRLEGARTAQRRYALRKTKPKVYAPGDAVWLAGKHIQSIRPCKKLDYKYYGPFQVLEAVGPQAYRLDITGHLRGIHPVFHVSLLEPVQRREGEELPAPSLEIIDGVEENEVKAILDSKISNRTLYYLVEWLGHSDAHNEWLKADELRHAADAIAEYHGAHPMAIGPNHATEARKEGEGRPRGRPRKDATRQENTNSKRDNTAKKPGGATGKPRGRPRKEKPSQAGATHADDAQSTRWDPITPEYLRSVTKGLRLQ